MPRRGGGWRDRKESVVEQMKIFGFVWNHYNLFGINTFDEKGGVQIKIMCVSNKWVFWETPNIINNMKVVMNLSNFFFFFAQGGGVT